MREVKREAKVGEKVKIVNARDVIMRGGKPDYKNGDILEIVRFNGCYVGYTDESGALLYSDEYVVLEEDDEMKFKVGDVVRVKKGLMPNKVYGGLCFMDDMLAFCGRKVKIEGIGEGAYGIGETGYLFTDAMLEPVFTKADLKPCMVVKQRDGQMGIISAMDDGELCINFKSGAWMGLVGYREDLMNSDDSLDIMEVYGFSNYGSIANKIVPDGRELLFRREESKRKMTVAEICKALGEEIEIVEG